MVPAGGAGMRMGGAVPKQFLPLGGRPILVRTLEALLSWPGLEGAVVVVPAPDVERTRRLLSEAGVSRVLRVVAGGSERQDSVRLGLQALAEAASDDLIFVHDGVRPFPPVGTFPELAAAARPDGAVLALACRDTLKRGAAGVSYGTVDRTGLWQAQTPQVFPTRLLREALDRACADGRAATDEAGLVEALSRRPRLVPGDARNLKVTSPEDLALAEEIFRGRRETGGEGERAMEASPGGGAAAAGFHVGHGYDVHRLVAGRKLVLGGVELFHGKGLLGHSDADVLAHAVADACLGAAGLGDLGRHFPDTDPAWAGASSLALLGLVADRVRQRGLAVRRVDATLVAERPRIARHVPQMEANLSIALGLAAGGVTVKATTTEGLGFEGREEGISAHAVALLERVTSDE